MSDGAAATDAKRSAKQRSVTGHRFSGAKPSAEKRPATSAMILGEMFTLAWLILLRGKNNPLAYHGAIVDHTVMRPFHLAFPVHDLDAARGFYVGILGCAEGRSSTEWIDFDLAGHQITAHLVVDHRGEKAKNIVDGHGVPIPHFGIILAMDDWIALHDRIKAAGISFGVPPHIRWKGQPGEQRTMFFSDPSGNALEFKAFADDAMLFVRS